MAKAFLYGTVDTPLNFKVVGGTASPDHPRENTIWIHTDTEITGWVFSAWEPAGEQGLVWITTGTHSAIAFNALKKNDLQVYPVCAKQYVDGAFVDVNMACYLGGKWTANRLPLLIEGVDNPQITGGWTRSPADGKIIHYGTYNPSAEIFYYEPCNTKNKVDVSQYKYLVIEAAVNEATETRPVRFCLDSKPATTPLSNSPGKNLGAYVDVSAPATRKQYLVPIGDISGECYITVYAVGTNSVTGCVVIYSVWLE